MALLKLNHERLKTEMAKRNLRIIDIANKMGISRQMAHYIIHKGGSQYSSRLSAIIGCREVDLLYYSIRTPKGVTMVNNKGRKEVRIARKN